MSDDDLDESENPAGRISVPDAGAPALPVGTPGDYKATRCSTCQKDVWPRGRGQCPICGRIVKGVNFASKQKVNIARRDAIRDGLITEYGPRTLVLRTQCEHLAAIYEGLDTVRAGTPEHQRLIASAKLISEALDEARRTDQAASPTDPFAGRTDDELIARMERVLDSAHSARDSAVRAGFTASAVSEAREDHPRAIISSEPDPSSTEKENRSSAALVVFCVYCGGPCVGKGHHAYETLHYSDPEVVKKRDEEATAVMKKQFGQPLPDWYR